MAAVRAFVSDIDGYVGAAVAASLRRSLPAGSAIIGSSSRPAAVNGDRVFAAGSGPAIEAAAGCHIIILSLISSLSEALSVVEMLREHAAANADALAAAEASASGEGLPSDSEKTVIAISSTVCWDYTTSVPQPFNESSFRRRRPGTRVADVRDAELALIGAGRPDLGIRVHIIAAGMPYGGGAGPLLHLLRRAWLCADNAPQTAQAPAHAAAGASGVGRVGLPVPCFRQPDGRNRIAAIHIKDLAAFVARVVAASSQLQPPESGSAVDAGSDDGAAGAGEGNGAYMLAFDGGEDTLLSICRALSASLGVGGTRLLSRDQALAFFAEPDATDAAMQAEPPVGAAGAAGAAAAAASASVVTTIAPSAAAAAASAPAWRFGGDASLLSAAPLYLSSSASFDASTASIFADPRVSLDEDGPGWHAKGGVAANADVVAGEFVRAHQLRPVRLVVLGAPGSGHVRLAAALAAKHRLPLVTPAGAVAAIRQLPLRALSDGSKSRFAALSALRLAIERVFAEHAASVAAAAAAAAAPVDPKAKGGKAPPAKAAAGKGAAAAPPVASGEAEVPAAAVLQARGPRLPRSLLIRCLRACLTAPEARNRGWVLAGFPRTWADAEALFGASSSGSGEGSEGDHDDGITPRQSDAAADAALAAALAAEVAAAEAEGRAPLTVEAALAALTSVGLLTPPDASTNAASAEAVMDDALALAEAQRKGAAIVVLGRNITAAASAASTVSPGTAGEGAVAGAGATLPVADDAALQRQRSVRVELLPTAVLSVEAEDAWLEQREISPAAAAAETAAAAAAAASSGSAASTSLALALGAGAVTMLPAAAEDGAAALLALGAEPLPFPSAGATGAALATATAAGGLAAPGAPAAGGSSASGGATPLGGAGAGAGAGAAAAGLAAGSGEGAGAAAGAVAAALQRRRLQRHRLHSCASLSRTALAWLESHGRLEVAEVRRDAAARLAAAAAAAMLQKAAAQAAAAAAPPGTVAATATATATAGSGASASPAAVSTPLGAALAQLSLGPGEDTATAAAAAELLSRADLSGAAAAAASGSGSGLLTDSILRAARAAVATSGNDGDEDGTVAIGIARRLHKTLADVAPQAGHASASLRVPGAPVSLVPRLPAGLAWLHVPADICQLDAQARPGPTATSTSTSSAESTPASAASGDAAGAPAAAAAAAAKLSLLAAALSDSMLLRAVAPFACRGGRARNFSPLPAEAAREGSVLRERCRAREAAAAAAAARMAAEARGLRDAAAAEAAARLAAAAEAESALLEARTAPLRSFLLESVVPTLAAGLADVCRQGAADPVDALADFLAAAAVAEERSARAAGGPGGAAVAPAAGAAAGAGTSAGASAGARL